jgi:hypothetical protein
MLWFALLALVMFSCERELEYDLRTGKPMLVVNSIFGQDSLFRIEISSTANPGDGSSIISLSNARIFLTEDGIALTDMALDSTTNLPWYVISGARSFDRTLYYYRTMYSRVRAGRDYHITVSYPGYETAQATARIPRAARLEYHPERGIDTLILNGKTLQEVQFSIQDDGQPHYYALELVRQVPGSPAQSIEFYSFDPTFSSNLVNPANVSGEGVWYFTGEGVYIANNFFIGAKKEFSIYLDSAHFGGDAGLKLRVVSMSPDFYQFAMSYQQQRRNAGNPFAEPISVHSNVHDGRGIFAGFAVSEVKLQ